MDNVDLLRHIIGVYMLLEDAIKTKRNTFINEWGTFLRFYRTWRAFSKIREYVNKQLIVKIEYEKNEKQF